LAINSAYRRLVCVSFDTSAALNYDEADGDGAPR
jgi:hypothetical protein